LRDVSVEGHLPTDLELVHVHRLAEELHRGLDHPRMARKLRERVAVEMRGEVGAHGVAVLLAHVLGTALRVEHRHLVQQRLDLRGGEMPRKENVAVALEALELLVVELHAVTWRTRTRSRWRCHPVC
jgi:hypothetical protein